MAHIARSGTLTASVVTTVDLGDDVTGVLVTRHTGNEPIYITLDGSTPTVGGNDCFPVDGVRYFPLQYADDVSAKLICAFGAGYTVEASPA